MMHLLPNLMVGSVVVLISGCTRSVAGVAEMNLAAGAAISSSAESSSAGPSKFSCPARALVPTAGTFCHQIPAGFVDWSSTVTYPGSDPVRSAVQIRGTEVTEHLIFVTSTVLDLDADNLSGALIKASPVKALDANASASSTTAVQESKVAGYRVPTTIKFCHGVQQRDLIVYAAYARVSVACQFQDHVPAITAGCAAALTSLQIRNP